MQLAGGLRGQAAQARQEIGPTGEDDPRGSRRILHGLLLEIFGARGERPRPRHLGGRLEAEHGIGPPRLIGDGQRVLEPGEALIEQGEIAVEESAEDVGIPQLLAQPTQHVAIENRDCGHEPILGGAPQVHSPQEPKIPTRLGAKDTGSRASQDGCLDSAGNLAWNLVTTLRIA